MLVRLFGHNTVAIVIYLRDWIYQMIIWCDAFEPTKVSFRLVNY